MLWGTKNFVGAFKSVTLNGNTQKVAMRFTALVNDSLTTVKFAISAITGSPGNITVTLQEDSNGVPSGVALATVTVAPSSGFDAYNLTNYLMTSGQAYHIVISPVSGFDTSNYITILYADGTASAGV